MDPLITLVRAAARRVVMPIALYPGAVLTGAKTVDLVTSAAAQFDAAAALHERYRSSVVMSGMDLSVEAEAFGAEIHFADGEVPTVTAPALSSPADVAHLGVPSPGDKRTAVYLETVDKLKRLPDSPVVLGGCIGPFSLAGRLVGVSEAFSLTLTDPAAMHALIEKCARFLESYVRAFRLAGADGLIMAEPSAGLLSPAAVAVFSSAYIRRIVESTSGSPFSFVLHNCAARLVHLPAILEAGARIYHFGAPMDLPVALSRVDPGCVLCGNLDPAAVFCRGTTDVVEEQTAKLLESTAAFPNHILSSGCDLPPQVSLAVLDAFHTAADRFRPVSQASP
ncbi:MAG: uroporphyrinogen decarboxylase family protein [Verrucomicrobia bacterium]|nr:uroporphyrinogen decarboxylase family protein [Verrucomicrobiota bacterium]